MGFARLTFAGAATAERSDLERSFCGQNVPLTGAVGRLDY